MYGLKYTHDWRWHILLCKGNILACGSLTLQVKASMKILLLLALNLMPWTLKRLILTKFFGYQIHPTARIGLALVSPKQLIMDENSRIEHATVIRGIDLLHLKRFASIGRANWISGYPSDSTEHFVHNQSRKPALIVGEHAAVTHRHLIDCTDTVIIGAFSILAGFRSQVLTHSIDLKENRQSCLPITIGSFSFVGTDCVLLPGSVLPDYCVLGAKSLLDSALIETYQLYAGTPAAPVKALDPSLKYFCRQVGFVK